MSNFTPHTMQSASPLPTSGKENARQATSVKAPGSSAKTPSKSRVSLGAPASFYFKYVNSSKKGASTSTSLLDESTMQCEDDLTGAISIPGLNKSINKADNSLISFGASSSDGSDGDMLNKSTLSDTTDLTASSFVLQATSRQVLRQLGVESKLAQKDSTQVKPTPEVHGKPAPMINDTSSDKGPDVLLAEETPTVVATAASRQSLRGASPSLRQRMSATPQSLQKFTEDLRNQRMSRQAKQEAMHRLSMDSKSSIQSLNAQLEFLNGNNDTGDTANKDRKRLPPPFAQPHTVDDGVEKQLEASGEGCRSQTNNKSCTTQEIVSAMEESFAVQQDSESLEEEPSSRNDDAENSVSVELNENQGREAPSSVPKSIDVSDHASDTGLEPLSPTSSKEDTPMEEAPTSPSSPMTESSDATKCRRAPSLTPTKLKSTPRRIPNPKLLDSPARNTRSSAKKKQRVHIPENKEVPLADNAYQPSDDEASGVHLFELSGVFVGKESSPSLQKGEPMDVDGHPSENSDVFLPTEVERGEGDTASLGDFSGVFLGSQFRTELSEGPKNASSISDPEDTEMADAEPSSSREGNTASPTDISGIPGSQSQQSEASASSLKEESVDISPNVFEGTEGEFTIANNEASSSAESVSVARASDEEPAYNETHPDSRSRATSCKASLSGRSEDDKCSTRGTVGEKNGGSNLRGSQGENQISLEFRISKEIPPAEAGADEVEETRSLVPKVARTCSNIASNSPDTSTTSMKNSNLFETSQHSFGSSQSSKSSENDLGEGDTASLSDIADILGKGSSQTEVDSPNLLHSGGDDAMNYERIKTQMSQTPRESASKKLSYYSSGSVDKPEAEGPETALISDFAEILGSAPTLAKLSDGPSFNKDFSREFSPLQEAMTHAKDNDSNITSPKVPEMSSPSIEQSSMEVTSISSSKSVRSPDESMESGMGVISSTAPQSRGVSSETKESNAKTGISLTPSDFSTSSSKQPTANYNAKLTPTKIAPSPRRVVNPHHTNSPARNTRSAKKADLEQKTDSQSSIEATRFKRPHFEMGGSQESESSKFTLESDTSVEVQGSKRRKSSIIGSTVAVDKENSTTVSPMRKKYAPVGILSSRKKIQGRSASKSYSQRSVAFGSPEAAEYHVGSPSVSMTPMPSSKARALYSIPRGDFSGESSENPLDAGEGTVEIEADLNILVDKITVDNLKGSPELSPISNARDDTGPVVLPGNYKLSRTQVETPFSPPVTNSIDESTVGERQREEMTVELEGRMEGLLASMYSGSKHGSRHQPLPGKIAKSDEDTNQEDRHYSLSREESRDRSDHSPDESSVEMTDAQSIASMNTAKSDKFTSKLQLDAQKLDFCLRRTNLSGMTIDSGENMGTGEGATVELENGMTGLLAAAGVHESLSEIEIEQQEDFDNPTKETQQHDEQAAAVPRIDFDDSSYRSRRSSIASHRFTLDSNVRVNISSDGSVLVPEHSCTDDSLVDVRSPDITETRESHFDPEEPISLTFDQILGSSDTLLKDLIPAAVSRMPDGLISFHDSCTTGKEPASGSWNQFFRAVCSEVERRTESDNVAVTMASTFASDPGRFAQLQRVLRSENNAKLRTVLEILVTESYKAVASEWKNWSTTVLESFWKSLNDVCNDLGRDLRVLQELDRDLDRIQDKINMRNKKKLQKARRKSLVRRQTTSTQSEADVHALERAISDSTSALTKFTAKEREYDCRLNSFEETKHSAEELSLLRPRVQTSQNSYLSLKGLHSWVPFEMAPSNASFTTFGNSMTTCTTVFYDFADPKRLTSNVKARAEVSDGTKKSLRKYSGPVTAFLDTCVRRLAENMTAEILQSPSALSQNIQNYVWSLGRLEFTAGELHGLLSRYKGALHRTGAHPFVLTVEFEGDASKLSVDFVMEFCYPSRPLEVKMEIWEGNIDFKGIETALIKNAKPGFGYLSRACDIVNAYVKQAKNSIQATP